MSYTAHKTNGESKADIHHKYAKLRTEVGYKNSVLRSAYEKQVNQQLRDTVKLEQAHFQKQVDATVAEANRLIQQANAEAEHWRGQVEIIYSLLEDTTAKAEAEIARLSARIAQLEASQQGPRPTKAGKKSGNQTAKKPKPKGYKPKREVEE